MATHTEPDIRYFAINDEGRQRVGAVNEDWKAIKAFLNVSPYWQAHPPTRLVIETRETIPWPPQ